MLSLWDFYLIGVRFPGAKAAPRTEEVSHYHHLVATTATAGAPSPKGRPGGWWKHLWLRCPEVKAGVEGT